MTPPVSDLDTTEVPKSQGSIATDMPIGDASNEHATVSVEQERSADHLESISYDISPRSIRFLNVSNPTLGEELPVSCRQFD